MITPSSIVAQAVGAGSMCWEDVGSAGVFQSDRAATIVDEAIRELGLTDEEILVMRDLLVYGNAGTTPERQELTNRVIKRFRDWAREVEARRG